MADPGFTSGVGYSTYLSGKIFPDHADVRDRHDDGVELTIIALVNALVYCANARGKDEPS
jgi:hypothetical protein